MAVAFFSSNILTKINNSGFMCPSLASLVFKLQKQIFTGTRIQDSFPFRVCDLCSFSLLSKTSNVGLTCVLLSLVSKVQETSLSGIWNGSILLSVLSNRCFWLPSVQLNKIFISVAIIKHSCYMFQYRRCHQVCGYAEHHMHVLKCIICMTGKVVWICTYR